MRRYFRLLPSRWIALQVEGVLLRAMHADDLSRLFQTEPGDQGKEWLEQQERGGLYVAVAEVDGVPVGRRCLNFTWQADAGAVYCFAAFVLPVWQSQGIGTLIDRHCEAVARARGFHALRGAVAKTNARALAWHERLGYRKIDDRVERWEEQDGEHEADCWILERRWANEQSFISRLVSRWRGR